VSKRQKDRRYPHLWKGSALERLEWGSLGMDGGATSGAEYGERRRLRCDLEQEDGRTHSQVFTRCSKL